MIRNRGVICECFHIAGVSSWFLRAVAFLLWVTGASQRARGFPPWPGVRDFIERQLLHCLVRQLDGH